jgi:ubiquinone/menaquinone biosynthesis C-methylase UbiE
MEPGPPHLSQLHSLEYDEKYYKEHAEAGLDYLGHGFWQESYGLMVAEMTDQTSYEDPLIVDAGCACGSILNGFRKTGIFKQVVGIDLSQYMVELGRRHFGFSDEELIAGSITNIPLPRNSVSLLHSAQVLEHIPEALIDDIIDEFSRVLRIGGRAFICLDAIRSGETKEMYLGDPTHVNIQPFNYWTEKLQSHGLLVDIESYNRFVRSRRGPTQGDPCSFYETYPYWSSWTLIKTRRA